MLLIVLFLLCTDNALAWQGPAGQRDTIEDHVWKVEIEGNTAFREIVLKQIIAIHAPTFWQKLAFWNRSGFELDELEIKRDVIRIRRYYQRRGFIHVMVDYRIETGNRDWKKQITFVVDENVPVRISDLSYSFHTSDELRDYITRSAAFRRARQRHEFQVGRRYETVREPDVIGRFNDVLKNTGFAFAEVEIESRIDSTRNTASLTFHLRPGVMTYFDEIRVQGTRTISDRYIVRETGIQKGERYEQDKLQQAQREIFNHHLFRFATINIPDQNRDSTLEFDITVRERSLRSLQALAGVGSEDIVRGQLSWTHRNVFYTGHRLSVTGRASLIEQILNLDYLIPYVFNTKSSLVVSPFVQHLLERRIFELFHGGITNSFIYQYRDDLTGTASYQFTRNLELTRESEDVLPDTTYEYDLSSFQFSGFYSPGFARRGQQGWVVQPYLEFSGLFGGAAFAFQKISLDIRRFTKLSSSTTFAARIQAGGIFDVDRDSLPQNIRYYLGGTSSVRGWSRNTLGPKRARFDTTGVFTDYVPIGGRAQFSFNAEIRQKLDFFIRGLGIAVFLDGGQVWRDTAQLHDRPVQFGLGGGLRYQSPIGSVRIDVGYKLNPTDEDLNRYGGTNYGNNWDRIGIHFSIGQAF